MDLRAALAEQLETARRIVTSGHTFGPGLAHQHALRVPHA